MTNTGTLLNPCIPPGWTLVKERIEHPRDQAWGDLLCNDRTGVYVHMIAGVARSIDPRVVTGCTRCVCAKMRATRPGEEIVSAGGPGSRSGGA